MEQEFIDACEKGDLNLAKHILRENPTINISADNDSAFQCTCYNGHLEVAQWLLQVKPTINISADNESAFCWACANGHLEVAQWLLHLASTIPNGIGGIDISANNEWAFRLTCEKGYLKVAKWLLQVKPTIDISADKEYAFCWACFYGHLEVAQWLFHLASTPPSLASTIPNGIVGVEAKGVEAKKGGIDISAGNEFAFRWACTNGHLEVVEWLLQLRPDKYFNKNIRNKKDQLWYRIQYLIELTENKKHRLYKLPMDIIWLLSFYI